MLEELAGIPARIANLKAKLAARTGKKEYEENCMLIKVEIARLEAITQRQAALASKDSAP